MYFFKTYAYLPNNAADASLPLALESKYQRNINITSLEEPVVSLQNVSFRAGF